MRPQDGDAYNQGFISNWMTVMQDFHKMNDCYFMIFSSTSGGGLHVQESPHVTIIFIITNIISWFWMLFPFNYLVFTPWPKAEGVLWWSQCLCWFLLTHTAGRNSGGILTKLGMLNGFGSGMMPIVGCYGPVITAVLVYWFSTKIQHFRILFALEIAIHVGSLPNLVWWTIISYWWRIISTDMV